MEQQETLIYICDDDPASVEAIRSLILEEKAGRVRTESFASGKALLDALKTALPDLVILDILMEGMDGIEVLKTIRETAGDLPVALYSSSPDFALDGYRLRAARYLEKPVKAEDVRELLTFLRKTMQKRPVLYIGRGETVPLAEIVYLEQQSHKIRICLSNGQSKFFYGRLDSLEPLGSAFVRCHKSFLVNLDHVIAIDKELSVFRMRNGDMAYIRKGSLPSMKRRYENRLIERVRFDL